MKKHYLVILPLLTIACATSQTVHWSDDLPGAASRIAELTAEHSAMLKTVGGRRDFGSGVSMTGDSLHWTSNRDGGVRGVTLDEVESIEFVTARHPGMGFGIGLLAGVTGGLLWDKSHHRGEYAAVYGIIWGAVGGLGGLITGQANADKIIFVREDP